MLQSNCLLYYLSAINESCIAVESTDSSVSLTWCQELVDSVNDTTASAVVGIFWNKNGSRFRTDMQSMQFAINGLTPNTEYLLLFDIESTKEGIDRPEYRWIATRQVRTQYFSKFIEI